jgi:hypothetical protein
VWHWRECLRRSTHGQAPSALLVGVGLDQTRINGKPFPTYQTFGHAAAHHRSEDLTQDVALTEAAVAVA